MDGVIRSAAVHGAADPAVPDEQLLARLAAGVDEEALAVLYDRYQAAMYGLAMRITNDPALAQDAVQEAFLGAWRNAARYAAERSSVRTWLLSIAHHRAIDVVRRRRATVPLPESDALERVLQAPDVWPEVARASDADALRAAMAELPEAQREVIELAYFSGLTQVEIAERVGIPLGTVKSRARLALGALRRGLEGFE